MDAWALRVVVLGIITIASTVLSAKWQTSPDPVIYACKGRTVQFPWKLNVDPRSEVVENVHWLYQGTFTSDLFATHAHGLFLPAPKYAGRVTQLQGRGVALRDVTPSDAGNYSVEALVRQRNTSVVLQLYSQSVYLQVSDGLMVQGGRLEVTQDPVAVWDMTSEQWTIRLWCGVFTYKAQPPVRVEWIIPSGDIRLSSGYTGGRFYLSLAAPVIPDGNYTCRVPQQFYPDVCPNDKRADKLLAADLLRASIVVDEMRARLTLSEAEQGRLRLDNGRLEATVRNLTYKLHAESAKQRQDKAELENITSSMKSDLTAESAKQRQDKAELENITNRIKGDLTAESAKQRRDKAELENITNSIKSDLTVESAKLDKSINSVRNYLSAESAKQRQDKAELENITNRIKGDLTAESAKQRRDKAELENIVNRIKSDLTAESAKQRQDKAELENITNSIKRDLTAESAKLRLDQAELENITNSIKSDLIGMRSELLQMQQSLVDQIQAVRIDVCRINYTTIDDANGVRDLNNSFEGRLCDETMTAGWYRWLLRGQDAIIPTSCTPSAKCGTRGTMWIDLNGQPLPTVGRDVQGRVCSSWASNCCHRQVPSVTVRNCGSFYIYYLPPPPYCTHAYCLQRNI